MGTKKKNQSKRGSSGKPRVEKHVREKMATERSLRRASELFLEPEEEEKLVHILAKLDDVIIQAKRKGHDDEIEDGVANAMSMERYMRRLLRDDRRVRKDINEGNQVSAEKIAARIRRTIAVAHREDRLMSTASTSSAADSSSSSSSKKLSSSQVVMALAMSAEAPTAASKRDMMTMSPTVRVFFELDKTGAAAQQLGAAHEPDDATAAPESKKNNKKKGTPSAGNSVGSEKGKLVVLQRQQLTVSDLLKQMRTKFNVGSKYNVVVIKSQQKFVEDELDFYKLQDDDVLQLSILPADKGASRDGKKKATKHAAEEILLSTANTNVTGEIVLSTTVEQLSLSEGEERNPSVNVTGDETTSSAPTADPTTRQQSEAGGAGDDNDAEEEDADEEDDEKWDAAKFAQMYRDTYMHPLASSASIVPDSRVNEELRQQLQALQSSTRFQKTGIAAQRASLPIAQLRDTILTAVSSLTPDISVSTPHPQVVLICGETGSGKTTQVPQYVLEDAIMRGLGSTVNIVVTQPRRIAAISVAERVSYEMTGQDNLLERSAIADEDNDGLNVGSLSSTGPTSCGDTTITATKKSLVGYQVRLEARVHPGTRLLFCTTGLLLRRLQNPAFWSSVSHIIVDEIHERNVETDFLLTILKQELPRYPHIRLILMSATMQEQIFQNYFHQCPIIYVPGRTFPVTPHYPREMEELLRQVHGMKQVTKYQTKLLPPLNPPPPHGRSGGGGKGASSSRTTSHDAANTMMPLVTPFFDAEVIADLITAIMQRYRVAASPPGSASASASDAASVTETRGQAILCFLSGIQAIEKLHKALKFRLPPPGSSATAPILCVLHGTMAPEQQRQAFRRTQPGQWKIVLATNIAETSITVDDVTHVIDTGLVKEQRYHAVSGLSILEEVFIARCNATQRAGRAGRVRPGHVWRLYSDEFFRPSTTSTATTTSTRPMTTAMTMQEFPLPEMQRIALEEVILQVLLLQLGRPEDFLSRCLQPPSVAQLRAAIATLIEVKAIAPDPSLPLTALGYHLAHLPVDVRLGKMLVYASLLQVVEPALTIAAYLSCRSSPFMSPMAQRDVARRVHCESYLGKYRGLETFVPAAAAGGSSSVSGSNKGYVGDASGGGGGGGRSDSTVGDSDHLAVVRAYDQWRHIVKTQGESAAYAYCRRQFLSTQKMQEIHQLRALYRRHLIRAGLIRASSASSVTSPAPSTRSEPRGKGTAMKAAAAGAASSSSRNTATTATGVSNRNVGDDDESLIDEDVEDCLDVHGAKDDDHNDGNNDGDDDGDDAVMDKDEEELLLRCALCAGFAPHFVRAVEVVVDAKRSSKTGPLVVTKRLKLVQADQKEVRLHPSSLLCGKFATVVPETARDAFLICYLKTAVGTGVNHNNNQHPADGRGAAPPATAAAAAAAAGQPAITTINLFDASVIPHPAILLFAGNNLDLKKLPSASVAANKKAAKHGLLFGENPQQHRRCVRVQVGGWIEMELSELHVSFYRRVQREMEDVFREQVETSLSGGGSGMNRRGRRRAAGGGGGGGALSNRQRLRLLRQAVGLLIRSFLPEEDDDEDEDDGGMLDEEEEDEEDDGDVDGADDDDEADD